MISCSLHERLESLLDMNGRRNWGFCSGFKLKGLYFPASYSLVEN